MGLLFDAEVTPDALTSFVRTVPSPFSEALKTILPDRTVAKNKVDISELTLTNRVAQFRAFDSRIHVSQRDAAVLKQVNLPALSSSIGVGELETLELEFARTGGTNKQVLVDAIYNDAQKLTLEMHARMELARGDVLTDGKFTLSNEGGLTMEADYGVPAGNVLTAATLWSNPAATIIQELSSWVSTYTDLNGAPPTGMIVSTQVMNALLRNTEIRSLAATVAGAPALVARTTITQVLDAYGLPPVANIYDSSVDVGGVTTKVVPANRVILFSENIGYTAWGLTATAIELVNSNEAEMSFEEAPGIAGVVIKDGPPFRKFTFVDGVGMPVLEQPKKLMIATVL
jgi:Phage major capsid protein E